MMETLLVAVSGLAWTIVYVDAIRIGFRQRTYAMPIAALGLNFAWETTYAVRDLTTALSLQGVINTVWALADLAIVYTFFAFGRNEFPSSVTRRMLAAWGVLVFGASYAVQWLFIAEFDHNAARNSAFLQNLLMSGLFIAMFVARGVAFEDRPSRSPSRSGCGHRGPHHPRRRAGPFVVHPRDRHPVQRVRPRLPRPRVVGHEPAGPAQPRALRYSHS